MTVETLNQAKSAGSEPATTPKRRPLIVLLNLAASIQVAWFYVAYVPSELDLPCYEAGLERTPFQQRLLMMLPLRWAHRSPPLNRLAAHLTAMPAWFPHGVRPEGIVEAAISLLCIVIAGLAARSLYEAVSPRRLLTPCVYPLTVVMIAATYCFNTMHRLRFVFDLPSLAFFSIGLWLIYFKRSPLLFAGVFVLATVNRETTLFLLLFYALRLWTDSRSQRPTRKPTDAALLAALAIFWAAWHIWITRHFAMNPTAAGPRFWLNIGTLLCPLSWPQILCTFTFCGPLCLAGRSDFEDPTLRAWLWVVPVWFLFMMRFGILIETRIFGELIPLFACTAALIAEQRILRRLQPASA